MLIAWGSQKNKLGISEEKKYSNIYYIEDRHSHAKVHNEILKAKSIVVMGGTFEAFQIASSIRQYLDSIGYYKTQIVLMHTDRSQVQDCLAGQAFNVVKE